MKLTDIALPPYWKLIVCGIIAAALGLGVASWMSRGAKIERLKSWQDSVILAVTAATVEPDKNGGRRALKPEAVPAAIAMLKQNFNNCSGTLAGIDQAALREKALQAHLDEQLATILDGQDQAANSAQARIVDLLNRKASGDREKDCTVMDVDSNAAWDGWRK